MSFWDYADFQRNYVFAKKPSVSKGICHINSCKQLMVEMFNFKEEIEIYKDYYAYLPLSRVGYIIAFFA